MTERTPGPRSRRERPAKPALSRAGIIDTAVRILRSEGLQRVTMRRLAQELDTGAASLYVYVRNTGELHAAILDELLGTVDLAPVRAAGEWRARLETVLGSYTEMLFEYPGLAQSALLARPSGPNYLRLIDNLLALLHEGGVPGPQAAWGVDVLLQLATASAAEHARDEPEADWSALEGALHGIDRHTYPHIAALGTDLLSGTPLERQSWAFRMTINGISHTPRTPQGGTHD